MELLERVRRALADRYDVEREVGEGGTAVVFLAQDPKHGRPVPIKVLRPDLAAAVGAERFLREIEIAATLGHPNILPLHDSGEADGLLYYVMPYVEGESLRARLRREGPPKPTGGRGPLPATVEAVLARALATSPADRYDSAVELADALTLATSEAALLEAGARLRRARLARAAALLALVALLALGGWRARVLLPSSVHRRAPRGGTGRDRASARRGPLDPLVRGLYGMTLLYEHRFEEAVSLLQATLKTAPNDPIALSTLRTAYHLMGRGEDALRIWKASYQALGNTEGVAALDRRWKEGSYEGALHAAAVAMEERSRS